MTGFGFGKGPPLTDEQRAVHDIRADETMALHARIAELEAALKPFDEMLQRDFSFMANDERYDDDFMSTVLMRLGDLRAARDAYLGEKE